jgi:hypothetical protein
MHGNCHINIREALFSRIECQFIGYEPSQAAARNGAPTGAINSGAQIGIWFHCTMQRRR